MPSIRQRWLVIAVLLAACVPYLSTITDYFVQDDFGTVMILTWRPWTMFPRWFTMPWMESIWGYTPDEIRPFVAFTYQLTGKWAPARPELHHAFNVAMHGGNALLVMAIGRAAVGLSPFAAAFAGIVFAVLPSQAESAAWITGRVDSMPAFFYLSTFLAYVLWRQRRRPFWYAWSVALFFVTLFSKQNAITMVATLAAYDLIVLDAQRRGTLRSCVAAWMPFAVMTAGYLALRQAVFGHTLRGGIHSWYEIHNFLGIVWRHFQHVALGHTQSLSEWENAAAVAVLGLCLVAVWQQPRFLRLFLGFCLAWWAIGAAPILVAGYESPRHVYLASAAWAYLLALLLNPWTHSDPSDPSDLSGLSARFRPLGIAAAVAAVAVLCVYVIRLHETLQTWHALARISRSAIERVHREAVAAPEGTLLLVSVPKKSWEWGVPFVLRPPYQPEDLTARVKMVTPSALYCCGADQWDVYARRHLRAWLDASDRPPLIALRFEPVTGQVSRLADAENPELRRLVPVLLQTDTPQALDSAIVNILERIVVRQ